MFAFIKGNLINLYENLAIIENNGIGYEIAISSNTFTEIANKKEVLLYTYLQVKEDGFTLYGFNSLDEKKMFLNLLTVSGVGCKVALAVLSGMSLTDLAVSIANENISLLSRVKGIGKKTAERIILELKEKVAKETAKISGGEVLTFKGSAEDAYSALIALGLTRSECLTAVKQALENGANSTEEIITFSLKNIR